MKKITMELTEEQASDLSFYLTVSTKYRIEEQKACEELSKELKEDGSIRYKKMKGNAEFWAKMNANIKEVENTLNVAVFK